MVKGAVRFDYRIYDEIMRPSRRWVIDSGVRCPGSGDIHITLMDVTGAIEDQLVYEFTGLWDGIDESK